MAETTRVHPDDNESSAGGSESFLPKPKPVPGSYVIAVPKDQIYRIPPPENAKLIQSYRLRLRRRTARPRPCRCLLRTLAVLLVILILLSLALGALYFAFRPKLPTYTVDALVVKGFNATAAILSPEFDLTVRADNHRNRKMGLYYRRDGSSHVSVSYSGVHLCSGAWPAFYQGPGNVTAVRTVLSGSGVRLSTESVTGLERQRGRREVPLEIDVDVPVRVRFGRVKSWTVRVKVKCDVVVDSVTESSRIVSKSCKTKVDL